MVLSYLIDIATWQYGFVDPNGRPARRHRIKRNVQFRKKMRVKGRFATRWVNIDPQWTKTFRSKK